MSDSCEYYEELMSRRLDGGLTRPEEEALSAHLRSCPACRRLCDALSAVTISLRDESAEPPPGFADGVMARVRAEAAPKTRRPVRLWPRLAAAACLAAVIGVGALIALRGRGGSAHLAATESAEYQLEANDSADALDAGASKALPEAPQAMEPAPLPEENRTLSQSSSVYGSEAAEEEAPVSAAGIYEEDAALEEGGEPAEQESAEDAVLSYTRDHPAAVPVGREAAFEALLKTDRRDTSDGGTDYFVIAAVEYRGVIYEFLTDAQERYLFWQDAAEGVPSLSPGTVGELWEILSDAP